MLTGKLLDNTRRQGRVRPRLIDPDQPALLETAEALTSLVRSHHGRRRGDLESALAELGAPGATPKQVRGLGHLLLDRCRFEVPAIAEPAQIRRALFDAAAPAWGGAGGEAEAAMEPAHHDPASLAVWRSGILKRVAAEQGIAAADLEQQLFADLPDNQLLCGFDALQPRELLLRYNLSQIQGLLLSAEKVELQAPWPRTQRLRQLMRYLKFFGLLYSLRRERETLVLTADGPLSLLGATGRYGMNLAQFFPALLLWPGPWQLSATLGPRQGKAPSQLLVEPHPWLRSHYRDQGQWVPEELQQFTASWNSRANGWRAESAESVLPLPGNRMLIPDFVLRHSESGRRLYLEVLPYPSRERVLERAELVRLHGDGDYLIACRRVPSLEALAGSQPWLVTFRKSLLPSVILKHVEALPGGRAPVGPLPEG